MDCEQALALISSRIDREILPSENAWLSEHLRECAACRATAEAFALQHAELKDTFAPRRAAVGATVDRVSATVADGRHAEARKRRLKLPRKVWIAAAAAVGWVAAAVILYTVLGWNPGPNQPPPPAPPFPGPQPAPLAQSDRLRPRPLPKGNQTQPLTAGQLVKTVKGERRRATLPNGAAVFLNEATELQVDANNNVQLLSGAAFFDFTNSAETAAPSGSSVMVTARDRTVLGPGTKFAVQYEDRGPGLLVAEGNVTVASVQPSPGEAELVVRGGEFLAPGATVAAPSPRVSHVLDWTHDLMAADTPLVPANSYDGGALIAVDSNGQEAKLSLRKYHVDVHVEDGFARTTIDQTYFNHHPWRLEGTFYFPLPPDASLSRLAMYVDGQLNEGGMVERDYGRAVYQRIVNNQRDPALLEWVDGSTFKMRVFPLEGRQEKRLILSYTQRVPTLYGRSQYRFPAGHSLQRVRDWSFHAVVKNGADYVAASPTHPGMKPSVLPNGDLVLDDAAENCKVDRDVVLDLTDSSFVAEDRDAVRFSRAESDGNEYLMMRYRPHLPSQKPRERRDWIFLYETSADRDPLLARTQIEVIRGMLQNAEREDTVHVLAASNRIRQLPDLETGASGAAPGIGAAPGAVPTTAPDEVTTVIQSLEQTHIVGALDLGSAFRAAEEFAANCDNPYLVHVGGGFTGMGTPQEELPKLLSKKTHYVGIGVGKRWDRAFMKQCAEKTGGYYTQINPDESISWRTFDVMATLNTPRLLDVRVAGVPLTPTPLPKGGERGKGEGDAGEARPRFLLDNNIVAQGEELCAVARLAARDGTDGWRKLAAPRELVVTGLLGGEKFERRVRVENVADNAGYVPRTWAKLEIDRLLADDARKHKNEIVELSKATYVMSPFTSLLVLENEAMYKEFKVDRGRKDHWALYPCPAKIPVVYEPDPTMPADVRNAPKGMRPAASEVLKTVCVRGSPRWLEYADRRSRDRLPIVDFFASPEPQLLGDGDGDGEFARFYAGGFRAIPRPLPVVGIAGANLTGRQPTSRTLGPAGVNEYGVWNGASTSTVDFAVVNNPQMLGRELILWQETMALGSERVNAVGFYDVNQVKATSRAMRDFIGSGTDALDFSAVRDEPPIVYPDSATIRKVRALNPSSNLGFSFPVDVIGEMGTLTESLGKRPVASVQGENGEALLYRRFRYSGDPRLFTDVLSYAPGLNTSGADILAVLDAEALPQLSQSPGRIDQEARKLIEVSRTTNWRKLTLGGEKDQPEQVIFFDGAGRYRYERQPALGLHEVITCDGETLLHQYPEIGLAGRRAVTRFHRAELANLLPWVLPPAEDLARGVDLKAIDENTVELVPHWLRDAQKTKDETPRHTRLHLVFKDHRLAERQLVEMPAKTILAREQYDGNGGVRLLDAKGKEVDHRALKITDADAPDLHFDATGQVVVSLPFRSRAHMMQEIGLNSSSPLAADDNGCFEYLDADDSLKLLTALVAEGKADEARLLYRRCFRERGDTRHGLFTLLEASGVDVSTEPGFQERCEKQPADELLQYLALCGNRLYQAVQQRVPLNQCRSAGAQLSFLRELSDAQALLLRWEAPSRRRVAWERRGGDVERSLAFLRRHPKDVLGLALLYQMQDGSEGRSNAGEERRRLALAAEWERVADASPDAYRPRYEQACSLQRGGKRAEAAAVLKKLYAQTLEKKALPPIDGRFKDALQELDDKHDLDEWNPLMLTTGRQFLKDKNYGAAVALARQCWQIGEPALAETLLAEVLAAGRGREDGWATRWKVIEFYARTDQLARADALLQPLLTDEKLAREPALWRAASRLSERRGLETKAIAHLEKALDLEYQQLPEVIDLQAWRGDYGKLLDHYHKLAEGAQALNAAPPPDLRARTLRAIDRWREHDPETNDACKKAAETFALLGEADLAWDYYTTTMIGRGVEPSPWQNVAAELNQHGAYDLADRALAVAAETDPTNAEVLWQRAKNLRQAGHDDEADRLLRRLAEEKWPARYQDIRAHARQEQKRR